jgi:SNF2 family DNA or RNA helicase
MDKEKIIAILSKIPKDILIHCAYKLIFNKSKKGTMTKTPLELELEHLTKSLTNPDLEDFDIVLKRIREIKESLKHAGTLTTATKPSSLIIPGAEYYEIDGITYFRINVKQGNRTVIYRDLHGILKNNSLYELDHILTYLGVPENSLRENKFYSMEDDSSYKPTPEHIALKNQKLIHIRDLINSTKVSAPVSNNCITRSKVALRDYQEKAIKFINDPAQKSLLVVHGTGTGKTLTALTASQCYLDAYPNDRVLVISPASLTGNFSKEMIKYGGKLSTKYSFYSFTKFTSLNKGKFKTPFDLYYEDELEVFRDLHQEDTSDEIRHHMAQHFNEEVKKTASFDDYKKRANDMNLKNLYNCNDTMVIVDEAHNMRNMGAAYDAVFKCVIQSKKLILLTATPYVNNLHDFTPLINMLYRDENILKKGARNKIPLKIPSEGKYFRALEVIFEHVKGKVTFLNDKTSEDFPSVNMVRNEIDMTPDFFKNYEKALIADRRFGDAPEVFYNGFRRAVDEVGADEYLNQKLDVVLEIVREGRQTLVFTNWIEAGVKVLEQAFQDNEVSYLIISGEVIANTRLSLVEKFNNKRVQVLIITLAGSEGLDLKEVRDVIILDPVWNGAVMEQIVGRAVRYKSHIKLPINERNVTVHNLILKTPPDAEVPSGDEILYAIIEEKQKQSDDVNKMLKNASI